MSVAARMEVEQEGGGDILNGTISITWTHPNYKDWAGALKSNTLQLKLRPNSTSYINCLCEEKKQ